MSKLHEKDEPFPWVERHGRSFQFVGANADEMLSRLFKQNPDFGIVLCNGCGRWQEFPQMPTHSFKSLRQAAVKAGWRHIDARDLCPVCVGN